MLKKIYNRVTTKLRRIYSVCHAYDYSPANAGWKKYSEPVLGGQGTYFDPYVKEENGIFNMYVSFRNQNCIVRCESADGIHWTEPKTVLEGSGKDNWEKRVNRACVINRNGKYYMWYTGQDNQYSRIGLATSMDGLHFQKYEKNPVLLPTEQYEQQSVMNPCVIWDEAEGIFKMWYSAGQKYEPDLICYAVSKDGIRWEKYRYNPVLKHGSEEYDKAKVGGCDVHKIDRRYVMFYIGYQNIDNARICEAESDDGLNWKRKDYNPILSPSKNSWDAHAVYKPSVYYKKTENKWFLWYNGRRKHREYIGLAIKD